MRKPLTAIFAAALLAFTGSAAAQPASPAVVSREFVGQYNVHARGMQAGEFTFSFSQTGATYQAQAERRLTGWVRALGGGSQDYEYRVNGVVDANGALRPDRYRHQGGRRNRLVQSRFTADDIITTAEPRMGMGDPPASQAQKRGAIDQLTAIAAMVVAEGEICERTLRVYMDGRSRFDFVMHPDANVNINGAAYRGPGIRCRVDYRPIAGFGDPQDPATLTFLFAPTSSGMYAPVRIEMPSDDAGIIVLDATRLTVNGQRLR